MLLVFQPLPSVLGYVVAILELLLSFGPVLAIFSWAASVMCPHASSLFLLPWAMWSLSLASLTWPGGMREAIESGAAFSAAAVSDSGREIPKALSGS